MKYVTSIVGAFVFVGLVHADDSTGIFDDVGTAVASAGATSTPNPWASPGVAAATESATDAALSAAPLVIGPNSHVVIVNYETWYGPNAVDFQTSTATPTLSSASMAAAGLKGYDSTDPAVITQHVAWLKQLHADGVTLDQTNNATCTFAVDVDQFCDGGAASQTRYRNIRNGIVNMMDAIRDKGYGLKTIPLLDAQDPRLFTVDADGTTAAEKEVRYYKSVLDQHPNQAIVYEGKPLLAFYVGTPARLDLMVNMTVLMNTIGYSTLFNYRFFGGYLDAQRNLWGTGRLAGAAQINPANRLWTYLDRYLPAAGIQPTYAVENGLVESFTAAAGFPGTSNGWNDVATRGLNDGQTLNNFIDVAVQLQPTFLFVTQFNEYGGSDQGTSPTEGNNLEPADLWGQTPLLNAAQSIARYQAHVGRTVVSQATSNVDGAAPGYFQVVGAPEVYYSNGQGHYCHILDEASLLESGGSWAAVVPIGAVGASLTNDGACKVEVRPGFFTVATEGHTIFQSPGDGTYCGFPNPDAFYRAGGTNTLSTVRRLAAVPNGNVYSGACTN